MTGSPVILALDGSTEACSVALRCAGGDFGRWERLPRGHSRRLLPMLGGVLAEAGIARSAIDVVAFCRGPGSFTGVRIAAGIAQGLAFALGRPLLPLSTLQVIAQGALRDAAAGSGVLVVQDARLGEVYCGAFHRGPGDLAMAAGPEQLLDPAAVEPPDTGPWWGVGSAFAAFPQALGERLASRLAGTDPGRLPDARDALALAADGFARGLAVPAAEGQPVYLRQRVTGR